MAMQGVDAAEFPALFQNLLVRFNCEPTACIPAMHHAKFLEKKFEKKMANSLPLTGDMQWISGW